MFSGTNKVRGLRTAAWRISLWATLAFAAGTMLVFLFLTRFVAADIQRRSDAWLSGEVEVLEDVASKTPKDRLYPAVVSEVAELASKEVPNRERGDGRKDSEVFFLQSNRDGSLKIWVGAGSGPDTLAAIRQLTLVEDQPADLRLAGTRVPYRVAMKEVGDGSRVYLGLSERDEKRVLRNLRWRFSLLGMVIVLIGFGIVFYTTRRMLRSVREITEAASGIGQTDLTSRVPEVAKQDEIGQLSRTLNHMLDRIESSMHQLHTITDSLAHDLRSPLTAIRGKLEMSLIATDHGEGLVSAIEELDRLTDFLNTSLDVAEAKADALRLTRVDVDLEELLRTMVDLYEPSMAERGLTVRFRAHGPVWVRMDAGLTHRMVSNLLDNEMKHLPAGCNVAIGLRDENGEAELTVEDDGPGFAAEIRQSLFERRVKGAASSGHGLGLAFVEAVARAHGGSVTAGERAGGGARLQILLPVLVGAVAV